MSGLRNRLDIRGTRACIPPPSLARGTAPPIRNTAHVPANHTHITEPAPLQRLHEIHGVPYPHVRLAPPASIAEQHVLDTPSKPRLPAGTVGFSPDHLADHPRYDGVMIRRGAPEAVKVGPRHARDRISRCAEPRLA
jgi:hypothetical protein